MRATTAAGSAPATAPTTQAEGDVSPDCEMIMGITGCDLGQATQYLEMSGGSVDAAVSLFFEMDAAPPLPLPTSAAIGTTTSIDALTNNLSPIPLDTSASADYFSSGANALHYNFEDDDEAYQYEDNDSDEGSGNEEDNDLTDLSSSMRDHLNMGRGRGDGGTGNVTDDDYDVVRKPDSVKKMSLLGRAERGRSNWVGAEGTTISSDTARDPTIDWLYPMQEEISFGGDIAQARQVAKGEKKWLLVNIQSHLEFDCHCLNRDTWTDENIREILHANFIFWQRGHTTQDASVYMTRYNVEEGSLPHVSILDPRTGLCMLTITGFRSPDLMSEIFLEFLDKHDIGSLNHSASPLSCSPQLNTLLNAKLTPQQQQNFSGTPPTAATPETIFSRMQAAGGIRGIAIRDEQNTVNYEASSTSTITPSSSTVEPEEEYDPLTLYGEVPEEPASSGADTTRVQIKLPKGRIVRMYRKSDAVKVLYATSAQDSQVERRPFQLLNTYPATTLTELEQSLEQAELLNAQVTLRYK